MSGSARCWRIPPAALGALLLAACASVPKPAATPAEPVDGPSTTGLRAQDVADAVPRPEPLSRYGNTSPYEVFGRTYYVMKSSKGYHERGIASWYGSKFHGHRTSSGEPYDMHLATAAHRTLPLPTFAEVTNLDNGRRVIVKINDRGPFVANRIIDLSYRAAQELDMIRNGTARVEVRALGAPAGAVAPATTTASTAPEPSGSTFSIISSAQADVPRPGDRPLRQLYVQVGAFANHDNAASLVTRLKRGGFDNSFIASSTEGHATLYRVRIGPLDGPGQFDSVSTGLRKIGVNDSRLVVEN
jgi:peptidoglycan lytic transglycosylase